MHDRTHQSCTQRAPLLYTERRSRLHGLGDFTVSGLHRVGTSPCRAAHPPVGGGTLLNRSSNRSGSEPDISKSRGTGRTNPSVTALAAISTRGSKYPLIFTKTSPFC